MHPEVDQYPRLRHRQPGNLDCRGAVRPYFASLDQQVFLSSLANVREAIIPDGRMKPEGSDAYQKVLLQTGHLKQAVAFDAVFTNQYLPA